MKAKVDPLKPVLGELGHVSRLIPLRGVPPAFQMDFMNLRNAGLLKFTTKRRRAWDGNQTSGMSDPVPSTLLSDQPSDTTPTPAPPARSVSDVPA